MKKMLNKNLAILAMIVALGFVMMACDEGGGDTGVWEPSNGDSVRVSNQTKTDLVAFKGSISKGNLLGGVRAQATNHPLKNASNLGNAPAQFRMLFITRDQYEKGYSSNTAIFTQMFVFWNGNIGDNTKIYEISDKLGGDYAIEMWNTSNFDVEFRVDGTAGPTLGFAQRGMTKTDLRVGAGEYMIYPIFQRINSVRQIVETVIPRYSSGLPVGWDVSFGEGSYQKLSLNLQEAIDGMSSRSVGAASVMIANGGNTGVRVYRGAIPLTRPTGIQVVNSGENFEFLFEMPTSTSTGSYADSLQVGNLRVQMMGVPYNVVNESGSTNLVFQNDKMYVVNVAGGGNNPVTAIVNTNSPADFKIDDDITLGVN